MGKDGICDTENNPFADPPIPPSGICTLPAAISQANHNPNDLDQINFNIPGPGVKTIVADNFGLLLGPVIIDGTTQPGFSGKPIIELKGTKAGDVFDNGLTIFGDGSAITGLVINGFSQDGIQLVSDGNHVFGNYIGTDATGTSAVGNGRAGIFIVESDGNVIGGSTDAERNVISGNGDFGIEIAGFESSEGVFIGVRNSISGNFIGTDITGTIDLGNGLDGVHIHGGINNTVEDNLISGNDLNGVRLHGEDTFDNGVIANFIGTTNDGDAPLPNGQHGVHIESRFDFLISCRCLGDEAVQRNTIKGNLISGNTFHGVAITGKAAADTHVFDNGIGTDSSRDTALPNGRAGVFIGSGANRNIIGTDIAKVEIQGVNTISGNGREGVSITGDDTNDNLVSFNEIGTNSFGTQPIPNRENGVLISGGAKNNRLVSNVISGNLSNGVSIQGEGTNGNSVGSNFIGTDVFGSTALSNTNAGVFISGGAKKNKLNSNVISGNLSDGVSIQGEGTDRNDVSANVIGTDISGLTALPNTNAGVFIGNGATENSIGFDGDGGVISGNTGHGIMIEGQDTQNNVIFRSKIGTTADGRLPLPNGRNGVFILNASQTLIGGANVDKFVLNSGDGNLISGNTENGIELSGASQTLIQGNIIGLDFDGSKPVPNELNGVLINDAPQNLVGNGPARRAGFANLISGNAQNGIRVVGPNASENILSGNFIGTDLTGLIIDTDGDPLNGNDLGNGTNGVLIENAPRNEIIPPGSSVANVISGNNQHGVFISGELASENLVLGVAIGTDVDGDIALGNAENGVLIEDAPDNEIENNFISANVKNGVVVRGKKAAGNEIRGNLIGISSKGPPHQRLGNGLNGTLTDGDGILIDGAPGTVIGGLGAGHGNTISANEHNGVRIVGLDASENIVQGNIIGTDSHGTSGSPAVNLGNGDNGVLISDAPNNTIGGIDPGARNVISANHQNGIAIEGIPSELNKVEGNLIGTDHTGDVVLGNRFDGIFIEDASNNTIGGDEAGAGNVISGNEFSGVVIQGALAEFNRVEGNLIGTDHTGDVALGNGFNCNNPGDCPGILIENASNNTIGGIKAGARNVVSGNFENGAKITGSEATDNKIVGNFIGTDHTGREPLGNDSNGIIISDAERNIVGGIEEGSGNVISANGSSGVVIQGNSDAFNRVEGNIIGLNVDGEFFLDPFLGNRDEGVLIHNSGANTIGGLVPSGFGLGPSNLISGNGRDGVRIVGDGGFNAVHGIVIGSARDLLNPFNAFSPAPNGGSGIHVETANNTIGGPLNAGNRIFSNVLAGVTIFDGDTVNFTNNLIAGNFIAFNDKLGIDLGFDGVTGNDLGDGDAGPNERQNFPQLTSALDAGVSVIILGHLNSRPSASYTVELFHNNACDASGFGEGERPLAVFSITTSATGDTNFLKTIPKPPGGLLPFITATATDHLQNTSEFSQCLQVLLVTLDSGDAPDGPFPTRTANNGARHVVVGDLHLGEHIDAEIDGQPDEFALGDDDHPNLDDEDGVVFTSKLVTGETANVQVTASGTGLLNAWLDFNIDGDWADAGEQIFTDEPLVTGVNALSFSVPDGSGDGFTFARFRLDTAGGLSFDGLAADGEVEDYQVEIVVPNPKTAEWNGDDAVGDVGDGTSWSDPNNWSRPDGNIQDLVPNAEPPGDDIVFKLSPTVGTIDLESPRTVNSLSFQAGYTLENHTLTVTSGNVTVDAGVTASIASDIVSPAGITKLDTGTLTVTGTAPAVEVQVGTFVLESSGSVNNMTIGSDATAILNGHVLGDLVNNGTLIPTGDSAINAEDIDAILGMVSGTVPQVDPRFDLVSDLVVTVLDVRRLVEDIIGKRLGDADLDGGSAIDRPHQHDRRVERQSAAVNVSEAVWSRPDQSKKEAVHTLDVAENDRFALATSVKRVHGSHKELELLDQAFRDGFDELLKREAIV